MKKPEKPEKPEFPSRDAVLAFLRASPTTRANKGSALDCPLALASEHLLRLRVLVASKTWAWHEARGRYDPANSRPLPAWAADFVAWLDSTNVPVTYADCVEFLETQGGADREAGPGRKF